MDAGVAVHTLPEGQFFRMDWRKTGASVGRVVRQGHGSVLVHIPSIDTGGDAVGWEDIPIAPGTMVIPISTDAGREFSISSDGRIQNRSVVESPVAMVHRLCDELKGDRDAIIAKAVASGVNISTAKTQFYAWRKKNKR